MSGIFQQEFSSLGRSERSRSGDGGVVEDVGLEVVMSKSIMLRKFF